MTAIVKSYRNRCKFLPYVSVNYHFCISTEMGNMLAMTKLTLIAEGVGNG